LERKREMTERMKEKQNRPEPTIKSREMAVVEQNHNTRTINSFKIAKLYISTSTSLDYENHYGDQKIRAMFFKP
jgi:hypothetical protein